MNSTPAVAATAAPQARDATETVASFANGATPNGVVPMVASPEGEAVASDVVAPPSPSGERGAGSGAGAVETAPEPVEGAGTGARETIVTTPFAARPREVNYRLIFWHAARDAAAAAPEPVAPPLGRAMAGAREVNYMFIFWHAARDAAAAARDAAAAVAPEEPNPLLRAVGRRFWPEIVSLVAASMYDAETGFDSARFHRNGTRFNNAGYNWRGWDRRGFNSARSHWNGTPYDDAGFNWHRYHRITRTLFDLDGYDYDGYNKYGFNRHGYHRVTHTKFDPYGRDMEGYDTRGFRIRNYPNHAGRFIYIHRNGTEFDDNGRDYFGNTSGVIDSYRYPYSFNWRGIHWITGTDLDPEGYDVRRFNAAHWHRNGSRFDKDGWSSMGYHRTMYDAMGRDPRGRDFDGIDRRGFRWDRSGRLIGHIDTGTDRDPDGYDWEGYNRDHRDRDGYDRRGFNRANWHWNGTRFDEEGLSAMGVPRYEYDAESRDPRGRDFDGIDLRGFLWDRYGVLIGHVATGTDRDPDGYDWEGYNEDLLDRDGNHYYDSDYFREQEELREREEEERW